jgi:hypothetical protein
MRSRFVLFAGVVSIITAWVWAPSALAQARERRNVVSLSPLLGNLGFARINMAPWAINYERRLGEHLGVIVEATGVHVHGPPMHVWLFGGSLGVRWHFTATGSSPFVGLHAGYRGGFGRNAITNTQGGAAQLYADSSLSVGQMQAFANVGYRWIHALGVTVTGRIGAGFGPIEVKGGENSAQSVETAQVTQDVLGFTPVMVDAELSVGYSF